jgi:hypothetical protein
MKTILLAAVGVATAIAAQPAVAQMTCNTFGTMQTCNGPNGYLATQNQFGPMTTGRDSLGNSWTTNQFGSQTTTQFQPGFRQRGW